MVEVLDLLQKNVVFEERRATVTGFQRVLIIGNDCTGLSCKGRMRTSCELMQLSAIARKLAWLFMLRFAFNGEAFVVSWTRLTCSSRPSAWERLVATLLGKALAPRGRRHCDAG